MKAANIRFAAMLAEGSAMNLCVTIFYYLADVIPLSFSYYLHHQFFIRLRLRF